MGEFDVSDEPVITDAEVEAFHERFSKHGFDARSALAAFLKARVPEPMPVASTLDCLSAREMYARLADDRGAIMYNACREAVLRGKP